MSTLTCSATGNGSGSINSFLCGAIINFSATINVVATSNPGSTFAGWSCVSAGGGWIGYSTSSTITNFIMPAANVTCTATFNLAAPPPPVAASVGSDLALFLTFLGVIAITGFQRWRKRTDS